MPFSQVEITGRNLQVRSLLWLSLGRSKLSAEEVVFIPGWALALLRNIVAQKENHSRGFGSGIVVQRLFHIVQRCVVMARKQFLSLVRHIASIADIHRRYTNFDKRKLIGANE